MISNLFILSSSGDVLIEKHWRGTTKRNVVEFFWEEVTKVKTHREVFPVITTPHYYLINVYRSGLFFLTSVQKEVSPLLVVEIQHRIVTILLEYFKNRLDENTIRENFSVVYQLLDEMVDGGFPSTTEPNQLKEMIIPPSVAGSLRRNLTGKFAVKETLAVGTTSKIPWRKDRVKYVTNEIYFDVVEEIDCIIGSNQMIVSSEISGSIECNCKLSGMPDLTLTFARSQLIDNCSLHRCVRINRYRKEKVISFVPPDGNFTLLKYRVSGSNQLPVFCKPEIDFTSPTAHIKIDVGPKFTGGKPVEDLWVEIPFPEVVQSVSLTPTHGVVKHNEVTKVSRWIIGKFPKEESTCLEGTIQLPPNFVADSRPTIRVGFTVKQFCASGLKVDGLAVHNVKYKPFKGVRSITKAGFFQVRC